VHSKLVNTKRIRFIKEEGPVSGPVVYWMSRDQRVSDNWALLHAQRMAIRYKQPLLVIFCLVPQFLNATLRQYGFMLKGLSEVEKDLTKKGIPFFLLRGEPSVKIPGFLRKLKAGCLITDSDPLHIKHKWKIAVARKINIPFHEVDAHNIIPAWLVSQKQEFKLTLTAPRVQWNDVLTTLKTDRSVPEVAWIRPGQKAALKALRYFVSKKLRYYDKLRNNPVMAGTSDLSPYLHFGHISAQRVALEVKGSPVSEKTKDSFLEELIFRRELADNFCLYNRHYDSFNGFPAWGQKTLNEHMRDKREHLYKYSEFESGRTHDPLWNAAQMQMVHTGKMHGYMRMYWCKKILEWSKSPEEALSTAKKLNDKYELDGRDPNGYTGIAWSIGGLHDRPGIERKVFGKIRFMSYDGCRRKFDIEAYIRKFEEDREEHL
jgi:deoxyribodipyrimidine photo-lyase